VDLELRVWIKDARKRIHTISYVTDRVKEVFDREGIEIPYPKRDIHILKTIEDGAPASQQPVAISTKKDSG
jgi:small-conductance mechanosensitive channel